MVFQKILNNKIFLNSSVESVYFKTNVIYLVVAVNQIKFFLLSGGKYVTYGNEKRLGNSKLWEDCLIILPKNI